MFLPWHNEELEEKDFTQFLSQISSQCVLKWDAEKKKRKTFKISSKQMAATVTRNQISVT